MKVLSSLTLLKKANKCYFPKRLNYSYKPCSFMTFWAVWNWKTKNTPQPFTAEKRGLCVLLTVIFSDHVCNSAVLAAETWNSNTSTCLCSSLINQKGAWLHIISRYCCIFLKSPPVSLKYTAGMELFNQLLWCLKHQHLWLPWIMGVVCLTVLFWRSV